MRQNPELAALDDALNALEKIDPRHTRGNDLRSSGWLNLPALLAFEDVAKALCFRQHYAPRRSKAQSWLH